MDIKKVYKVHIARVGVSISAISCSDIYYVVDKKGMSSIPANKFKNIIYTNGNELKISIKKIDNNACSFILKKYLSKGEYVTWIGNNFWLIKIM